MAQSDSAPPAPLAAPSAFFQAHVAGLAETALIGPTLDLACGRGRHSLPAAALGLAVTAIDSNPEALSDLNIRLAQTTPSEARLVETLCADLETPPLPDLEHGHFGAVLVFNYLHRPLFPWIASLVAPGGFVLYETFTTAQRDLGWGPRRDAFLLEPGELPTLLPDFLTEVYEEGPSNDPRPAATARLLARRPLPPVG